MRTKMMLFFCLTAMTVSAANYEVSSPNGKVKVTVNTDAAVKENRWFGNGGEGSKMLCE